MTNWGGSTRQGEPTDSPPDFDRATAGAFLDQLYGTDFGFVAIGSRALDSKDFDQDYFVWPRERERLLDHCGQLVATRLDCYFTPGLLRSAERNATNGKSARCVWVDIDDRPLDAFRQLPGHTLVESSPDRYHGYLLSDNSLAADEVADLNHRLLALIGRTTDDYTPHPGSFLRLPGTRNWSRAGAPVRVTESNGGPVDPEVLRQLLPGAQAPTSEAPNEAPTRGLAAMLAGPADDERKGNNWMTQVLGALVRKGIVGDDLKALAPILNNSLADPLPEPDLRKMLEQAAKWAGRDAGQAEQEVVAQLRRIEVEREARRRARRLRAPGSLEPVDMAALVSQPPAPPTFLGAADSIQLGKVHTFAGDTGAGKTWAALSIALPLLERSVPILWLDGENGRDVFHDRLWSLRVEPATLARLRYFDRPDFDPIGDTEWLLEQVAATGARLVLIDSMEVFMTQAGLDNNQDGARFLHEVCKRVAQAGPAVIVLDHVGLADDPNRRHGKGSTGKLQQADVGFKALTRKPFSRTESGWVLFEVVKDRAGRLTEGEGRMLSVGVNSPEHPEPGRVHLNWTRLSVEEVESHRARLLEKKSERKSTEAQDETVALLLDAENPLTTAEVAESLEIPGNTARQRLNRLAREGKVRRVEGGRAPDGKQQATLWEVVR